MLRKMMLGTVTLLLTHAVWAADPVQGVQASDLALMVNAMVKAGQGMAGLFVEDGKDLAGFLFGVAVLLWALAFKFGPSDPGVRTKGVILILKAGLVVAMLGVWGPDANQTGSIQSVIVTPFDDLAAKVLPGGKGEAMGIVGESWSKFWAASEARSKFRSIAISKSGFSVQSLVLMIEDLKDKISTGIFGFFVSILAFILMISYLFVMFYGDLVPVLGMIVGPLMISGWFLEWQPINKLTNSWWDFMISGGFYKIIAAVIMKLSFETMSYIQDITVVLYKKFTDGGLTVNDAILTSGGYTLAMIMIILYMIFGIFLMWKVGDITTALMRGFGANAAAAAQKTSKEIVDKVAK